jgi:hypothetical protein
VQGTRERDPVRAGTSMPAEFDILGIDEQELGRSAGNLKLRI